MQAIYNYPEYTRLIHRVCRYEDLLGQQRILRTLYQRDKSTLVHYQAINQQMNAVLLNEEHLKQRLLQEWACEEKVLATPNDWNIKIAAQEANQAGKNADNLLQNLTQAWQKYIDTAQKLNDLIAWCMQNSGRISAKTLKVSHNIQQEIQIQEIESEYAHLEHCLQEDKHQEAEAKRRVQEEIELKRQEEAEQKAQALAEQKMREEAAIRAKAELERKIQQEAQQKAKAELEEKLRLEAERREKAKIEQQLKEEAERQAREEAEKKAREEAKRKAEEEKKRNRSHSSIDVDTSSKHKQCPVCQTKYPPHYKVCLKDGTKLVSH